MNRPEKETPVAMRDEIRRLTRKDWDAIAKALAHATADEWDGQGERPDFEAALSKVNDRRRNRVDSDANL